MASSRATSRGDLGDALELASKLAARSGDAQILVATDAALATAPTTKVDAPIRVLAVGRERKNQAIVALAVRTSPSAVTRSVFISVANLDIESAARRIEVWGDDRLLEARDVSLDAQARSDVVIDDVPPDVAVVEVRLVGADPTSGAAPDQLAIDDRAWAVLPATQTRLVLLVGEGDPYLETALSYLPNVELYGVAPADYGPASERTDGRPWDLTIFESNLPATLPKTPILAIAPPRSSALGDVSGTINDPGIGSLSPDEPILRYVDLSTTHISQAQRLAKPDWARTVIPGPRGAPLLYTGVRAGLPDRCPRVRTAAIGPAVAGRVPDPAREPHGRAARRLGGADRGRCAGHARQPDGPLGRHRPDGDPTGRHQDRPHRERGRRPVGVVRRDRPDRHLHGDAHPSGDGVAGRVERRRCVRRRRDAALERPAIRQPVGVAGSIRIASGSERAGPLRRRPLRRRRIDDRARFRGGDRGARRGPARPRRRRGRRGTARRPTGRRPATSCGCRSCSSSWSACASNGRYTTAMRSSGCGGPSSLGSVASPAGPARWASRSRRRSRSCC